MYIARARQARGEFRATIRSFPKGFWPCSMASRRTTFTASRSAAARPKPPFDLSRRRRRIPKKAEACAAEAARRADAVGTTGFDHMGPERLGSVALNKGDGAAAVLVFRPPARRLCNPMTWTPVPRGSWPALAGRWPGSRQVREDCIAGEAVSLDEISEPKSRDRLRSSPMSKHWCWPANSTGR